MLRQPLLPWLRLSLKPLKMLPALLLVPLRLPSVLLTQLQALPALQPALLLQLQALLAMPPRKLLTLLPPQ